jgi:AraC-like DNA-binding protein
VIAIMGVYTATLARATTTHRSLERCGRPALLLRRLRKPSPELATVVSRDLLADIRSSQASYIIPNDLAQADPLVLRFERWARDPLKGGFSLQEGANALATSARSLQRRCQAALGKSPLDYFQDVRVERAHSLLHGSGLDIDAIAAEVGYVDAATLRTLLRQRRGPACAIFAPTCADDRLATDRGNYRSNDTCLIETFSEGRSGRELSDLAVRLLEIPHQRRHVLRPYGIAPKAVAQPKRFNSRKQTQIGDGADGFVVGFRGAFTLATVLSATVTVMLRASRPAAGH